MNHTSEKLPGRRILPAAAALLAAFCMAQSPRTTATAAGAGPGETTQVSDSSLWFMLPPSDGVSAPLLSEQEADKAADEGEKLLRDSLPEMWIFDDGRPQTLPSFDRWWDAFADPILSDLMKRAEQNNFNLSAALKRIQIAKKEIDMARSAYWPSLTASAGWSRDQAAGAQSGRNIPSSATDYFSVGLSASWEIDIFGRVAANSKGATASYNASRAEYEAAMVSMCASLAKAYIKLRTYQAEYDVALRHIEWQKRIIEITKARFEAGIGDMLEVTQAEIVLSSTQSRIPGLLSLMSTTANSIALLCGCAPADLTPMLLKPCGLPVTPALPASGIPADLLRRRPDILQSEYEVASLAAKIGVAKKDFLPVLSINGSISTDSHRFDGLFGEHSLSYNVSPTLTWTVFDGLARNIRIAEAKLQTQAAVDSYNQTVVNALCEVENALSAIDAAREEAKLEEKATEQSRQSLKLSVDLYKKGLTNFSNVVDAQMNFLTYQDSYITSSGDMLTAIVSLYEALGGGF